MTDFDPTDANAAATDQVSALTNQLDEVTQQLQTAQAALGEKTAEADALRLTITVSDATEKELRARIRQLQTTPTTVENENFDALLEMVDALLAEGGVHTFQGGVKFDALKEYRNSLR